MTGTWLPERVSTQVADASMLIGKEGVRSAVAEMTQEKTVLLHGRPW
jgi:hypothetical protein